MKKHVLKKLITGALMLLPLLKANQGKAQACDMSYRDTVSASGSPIVNHGFEFKIYQNCNANILLFSNMPVRYQVNQGIIANETAAGPLTNLGMGNPFCQSQTPTCSVTGPLNYQKSGYAYTFSLKANVAGGESFRTSIAAPFGSFQAANITGNFSFEPEVFNVVFPGMINTAPEFINPPVIFATQHDPVSYSTAAIDAEGDSLVYSLRPVSPSAIYAPGFTYLNPITANPALALNSRTGILTFTPTAYDATSGPGAPANKYVIGLDVEEYRKINGQITKIGTIQRNLLVNIISTGNRMPVLTATHNNNPVPANAIIDAAPGATVTMSFGASDPDNLDVVVPVTNANTVLPGSSFFVTLAQNPNGGQLRWTPTAAHVRDEPYFFNVSAVDNACPYPSATTQTFGIRVRNLAGMKKDTHSGISFKAFPNPFSEEVTFRLDGAKGKAAQIVICNLLGQETDRITVPASAEKVQEITWTRASQMPAGHYTAMLISEIGLIQNIRVVKTR